jgi:hypothetical protein
MTHITSHTSERSDFNGVIVGILTAVVVVLAGFLSLSQFAVL